MLHICYEPTRVLYLEQMNVTANGVRKIPMNSSAKYELPLNGRFPFFLYLRVKISVSRAQWPRGLRCGSAAALLLGLQVRISPGAWMSVYVLSERSPATGWSFVQRSSTECGVSECDHEASAMRTRPTRAVQPWDEKKNCKFQRIWRLSVKFRCNSTWNFLHENRKQNMSILSSRVYCML
jgi:hypothetical protein